MSSGVTDRTRSERRLRMLAVLVAGCAVLTACWPTGGTDPTPGAAEPITDATARASLADIPCPDPLVPGVSELVLAPEFRCGMLNVPEDWSAADDRTISIPIAILPAESSTPKPDPIVYLAGGPGGSGLLDATAAKGWNADRDVIFVGQRGTYDAEPQLTCPEVDRFKQDATALRTDDPATKSASDAAVTACRERLTAAGWDLSNFNTTQSTNDLAALRAVLGVDEWNVYGVSYGTSLAQQYLRDHPDGIRTVTIDGVVPPSFNVVQDWTSAATGADVLFAACAGQPACAQAFPQVEEDFTRLLNELAADPRTVVVPDPAGGASSTVVIDGYKLAELVVAGSSSPQLRLELPLIIDDLAHGDGMLAAQAMLPDAALGGIMSYGLLYSVQCAEYIPFTSEDELVSTGEQAFPGVSPSVVRYLPQVPYVFATCGIWDVDEADPAVTEHVRSDVPVLLLSGAFDGITPPSSAELVAENLPRSHLMVFPDVGHGVAAHSADCFRTVLHSFLDAPDAPDGACIDSLEVAPFATSS